MKRFLAALAVLGVLVSATGCNPWGGESLRLTVQLKESAGLFVGNDVGVLGVAVGEVTKIDPRGGLVLVTLSIDDPDIKIPDGVGAAVVTRSVATDRYLELTPAYRGGPEIEDGAVIPAHRTVTPVDFDEVLGSVTDLARGLGGPEGNRGGLGALIDAADSALAGNGALLDETVASTARAVEGAADLSDEGVQTLEALDALVTALLADKSRLRRFAQNVDQATALLAENGDSLGAALQALSGAVDDVAALTRRHRAAISRDVRGLTALLRNIMESRSDVEQVLDTLPLAVDNLHRIEGPGGTLVAKFDVIELTQLGKQVDLLCEPLGSVCDVLGIPSFGVLLGLIGLAGNS